MRHAVRARGGRPVALLLGAIAVTAISVALATGARAQSISDDCTKRLTEQFGAAEFSDVTDRVRRSQRSVYLDAKLKSGKTVRMRCLFRGGGVSEVQVYEEPGIGASEDWPTWGPADKYRLSEEEIAAQQDEAEAESEGTAAEPDSGSGDGDVAEAPAESEQGAAPDEQPAEQPAEESAEEDAGESAEQPAEESAEQEEQQFGVRKKAPTN